MSAILEAPPERQGAEQEPESQPVGDTFLLRGMSWAFYEHLLAELGDRPIRVTYDRGDLELMSPSYRHERGGCLLGGFVEIVLEEIDRSGIRAKSTTLRRADLQQGLEPDDCFWIENVESVIDREEIDLNVDPPPDLVIEMDVTRRSLNRLGIYAALRVPEVWRHAKNAVHVYRLNDRGEYDVLDYSPTFPFLPIAKLAEFIASRRKQDDIRLRREFRAWLRAEVLPKLNQPEQTEGD